MDALVRCTFPHKIIDKLNSLISHYFSFFLKILVLKIYYFKIQNFVMELSKISTFLRTGLMLAEKF